VNRLHEMLIDQAKRYDRADDHKYYPLHRHVSLGPIDLTPALFHLLVGLQAAGDAADKILSHVKDGPQTTHQHPADAYIARFGGPQLRCVVQG